MKKYYLRFAFITGVAIVSISLSSNSNGPRGNRTGAPGSSGDCSGCHGSTADPNGEVILSVLENGAKITQYQPGKTYDLELVAKGNSSKMGFQVSAINASNQKAGVVSAVISGTEAYNSGSQQIWAHTQPGITPNSSKWTAKWTAPESATGDVRFFTAVILSNSNGNNGGDYFMKNTFTLSEEVQSSTQKMHVTTNRIKQNPVGDFIYLENTIKAAYIWNGQGKLIAKFENSARFNVEDLMPGIYHINFINTDGSTGADRFVKQ
jgi:hypothetical protein